MMSVSELTTKGNIMERLQLKVSRKKKGQVRCIPEVSVVGFTGLWCICLVESNAKKSLFLQVLS